MLESGFKRNRETFKKRGEIYSLLYTLKKKKPC
jgi:hypothetical protein